MCILLARRILRRAPFTYGQVREYPLSGPIYVLPVHYTTMTRDLDREQSGETYHAEAF